VKGAVAGIFDVGDSDFGICQGYY